MIILLPIPPPSNKQAPKVQTSSSESSSPSETGKFITSDPSAFTQKLKGLENENEVIIALKQSSSPSMARTTLKEMPAGAADIIALPKTNGESSKRSHPGFAQVDKQSRQAIKALLKNQNVEQLQTSDYGHVITATLPKKGTVGIVTALLNNPNVDYIEANQTHPVYFHSDAIFDANEKMKALFAGPQGTNPSDSKHSFHNVLDAWDYTRGSGARIGILDSGFSYDQSTNSYHPDGKLISSSEGIKKLGFVNDFDSFGNCSGGSGQPYGNCHEWDDHGHGTYMTGLAGANDNSQGYVGIMPDGLTISMKIAQNCHITEGCANNNDSYNIESDDFYWAIEWARNNNIDVLSMSFSGTDDFISSSVYNSMYDAYHTDDIVLLSSTGNPSSPSNHDYPQKYNFVFGIGGLYDDGSNYGVDQYEDISALAGGGTVNSSCPPEAFCEPQGNIILNDGSGGTSSSTAIAAGIAGLIRAYNPSMTAPQVRQRLVNTSSGYHNKIRAYEAVTNDLALSVSISGPQSLNSDEQGTWTANVSDNEGSVNYEWYRRDTPSDSWSYSGVTSSSYSTSFYNPSSSDQQSAVKVEVTSAGESDVAIQNVIISSSSCNSSTTQTNDGSTDPNIPDPCK